VFERLKRLFQGEPANGAATIPEIPWIPADRNPWHVPVLDVRPVTQCSVSASKIRQEAVNAVSFGQDDGTGFTTHVPETTRSIPAELSYRFDRVLAAGVLFVPSTMEHRWALFYHGGRILCIRSWQRKLIVSAEVECGNDGVARVRTIQGTFVDEKEEPEFTIRALDFLIRSHALGIIFPAPLPAGSEKSPKESALWCMSLYGVMAIFATPHRVDGGVPEKPLRTHSLMHIAVARGEVGVVEKYLRSGLPVDLLAGDGLALLHWALAREDTDMATFLIENGSPVDVRSAEGATPLMTEVQSGDIAKVEWLLDSGADVNALDSRGFSSLHRAAEGGNTGLVKLLLDRGARIDVSAQGHTARSLAEKRGHADVVRLLETSTL
jgi:hypothetical protein